jgi:hypothetical protein
MLTDFNDLHQASGPEAVRQCIEGATKPAGAEPTAPDVVHGELLPAREYRFSESEAARRFGDQSGTAHASPRMKVSGTTSTASATSKTTPACGYSNNRSWCHARMQRTASGTEATILNFRRAWRWLKPTTVCRAASG